MVPFSGPIASGLPERLEGGPPFCASHLKLIEPESRQKPQQSKVHSGVSPARSPRTSISCLSPTITVIYGSCPWGSLAL